MVSVRNGGDRLVILESLRSIKTVDDAGTVTRMEGSIVKLVFASVIFTLGLVNPAKVPRKEREKKNYGCSLNIMNF